MSETSHPRRAPAHLSVSLRHESSASENATAATSKVQHAVKGKDRRSKGDLVGKSSDDSNDSEGSTAPNLQRWFDRSNKRPEAGVPRTLEDSKFLLCMIIRIGH
jgi:hypothetical protein